MVFHDHERGFLAGVFNVSCARRGGSAVTLPVDIDCNPRFAYEALEASYVP